MGELLHLKRRNAGGRTNNEWTWKKTVRIVMFLTFMIGILLANFMGREKTAGAGILNDYFIEKYKCTEINKENLFFYIMGERIPFVILLLLLTFSSLGLVIGIVSLGWFGFSVGFMFSAAIAKYGGRGILLVAVGMFPQYILYGMVYLGYCTLSVFLRKSLHRVIPTGYVNREQMRGYGIGIVAGLLLLLIFVTGIFLESYINPMLLKKILKFF